MFLPIWNELWACSAGLAPMEKTAAAKFSCAEGSVKREEEGTTVSL